MDVYAKALEKLLNDNSGPVSIATGIALLRSLGSTQSGPELQSYVGTYAAERWRPIRFDWKPD